MAFCLITGPSYTTNQSRMEYDTNCIFCLYTPGWIPVVSQLTADPSISGFVVISEEKKSKQYFFCYSHIPQGHRDLPCPAANTTKLLFTPPSPPENFVFKNVGNSIKHEENIKCETPHPPGI